MRAIKTLNIFASLVLTILLSAILYGCSGTPGSTATFTIGGMVTGLTGTGLVLQDNGGDNLTIAGNGPFTFATSVGNGKAYSVTVLTQPSNPAQTCTVTGGAGTATGNVSSAQVSCTSGSGGGGTFTIGGTVVSLAGTGLVLQDNGGDNLSVTASGGFTFATALAAGTMYNVTVLTQPSSPAQVCTVADGTGTANANVGNIVVTCSIPSISIGGSVSGLDGTGLVLQDNGGDNLTITTNGTFKFATLLVSGAPYNVTVLTQPSNPAQVCTVSMGTGTATANVTSVQVVCPAVFNTIGGNIVGLYVPTGQTANGVLQDNGGDNLPFTENGPFTFVTPIAFGSSFDVSLFVAPQTQPQGSRIYGFQGTATADVTSVLVDFGHNDWTWMSATNNTNQFGVFSAPPPMPTSIISNIPGGVRYPATWTDNSGNLWMFSGYGYSLSAPDGPNPWYHQEMWNYNGANLANYDGSFDVFWTMEPAPSSGPPAGRWGAVTWTDPGTGNLMLFGGQDQFTEFLNDLWSYDTSSNAWTLISGGANEAGVYGTKGTAAPGNIPGGRWGATGKLDFSGNFWLFGGFGNDSTGATGLLNDLWEFTGGEWKWVSGSNVINADGVYGTQGTPSGSTVPGGRQASMSWIDVNGNFWVFGGYNLSSTGQPTAFNDLWEFSGGQWTWVAGSSLVNQIATYGTQGVAASTNEPGARWNSAAWADVDVNGNSRFWLFGGQGYDATANGSLGDLWMFTGGQWTWIKGPSSVDQDGVYGLTPTPITWPNVNNFPGTRWGAGYWIDQSGQLWIFGGEGFGASSTNGNGLLNDMWRYLPYP
jgi:Galactose oxidase, central domain